MFFMGSNKTLDMFTVLHPLGYVSHQSVDDGNRRFNRDLFMIGILVPIISFKRRCYL